MGCPPRSADNRRPYNALPAVGRGGLVVRLLHGAAAFAGRVADHLIAQQIQRDIDRLPDHIRRDIGASQSEEARHRDEVERLRLRLGR